MKIEKKSAGVFCLSLSLSFTLTDARSITKTLTDARSITKTLTNTHEVHSIRAAQKNRRKVKERKKREREVPPQKTMRAAFGFFEGGASSLLLHSTATPCLCYVSRVEDD